MNKRGKRKYYTPKLINKIRGGGVCRKTMIISMYPWLTKSTHTFILYMHKQQHIINRLQFQPLFSSTSAHVYASLQTTSWTPCWSCHFFLLLSGRWQVNNRHQQQPNISPFIPPLLNRHNNNFFVLPYNAAA